MGYDRRGEDNTFRVGRLLKDLEADIAGLQETGLMRLTLGNRHYAGAVARAAGMVLAAAAPVAEDTWGCAIFSRLPVLSWGWRRLPRGRGENACEVHATLSLGEGMGVATVVNVHLGNEGDTEKQVTGLLSLLEDLRAGDLRTRDVRKRDNVRRDQQHIPKRSNQQRRKLRRKEEGEDLALRGLDEDRRLLIVVGDFNFESTSSGYRRMVSEGGLQSAANVSTEAAAGETASWYSPATASNFLTMGPNYPAKVYHAAPKLADDGVVPEKREVLRSLLGNGAAAVNAGDGVARGVVNDGHGDDALGVASSGGSVIDDVICDDGDVVGGVSVRAGGDGTGGAGGATAAGAVVVAAGAVAANVGEGSNEGGDNVAAGDADNSGALDFVFFSAGGGGISCRSYEVHREFSQERYADGYPSVAEFEVSCPSLALE
ncbi:unnamed protein product [Ectocarpus sp. 12 AP-2014]